MNVTKDPKSIRFELRATRKEKENISKLAKRLKVKESEAIRRAVAMALEITKEKPNG